jgi:hypothetical protein
MKNSLIKQKEDKNLSKLRTKLLQKASIHQGVEETPLQAQAYIPNIKSSTSFELHIE